MDESVSKWGGCDHVNEKQRWRLAGLGRRERETVGDEVESWASESARQALLTCVRVSMCLCTRACILPETEVGIHSVAALLSDFHQRPSESGLVSVSAPPWKQQHQASESLQLQDKTSCCTNDCLIHWLHAAPGDPPARRPQSAHYSGGTRIAVAADALGISGPTSAA